MPSLPLPAPPHMDAHPAIAPAVTRGKHVRDNVGLGSEALSYDSTLPLHCLCELGDSQNWVRNTSLFHEWRITKRERVAISVLCELVKCYILNKYSLTSVDLMTSGLCDDKYSTFINYCYLELTLFFYNGYLDNI